MGLSTRTISPIQPVEAPPLEKSTPFRLPLDPLLTLAVLGLGICSVFTLQAATRTLLPGQPSYYVHRQAAYLAIGVVAMVVVSRLDYAVLRTWRNAVYGALILSILAVLGLGHSAGGAQRAISLPFFSFQASELGKVLLIVAVAAFLVDRSRRLKERETSTLTMIGALVPAMLVIAQPDLGSGIVYVVVAFVALFVAGVGWRHLAAILAIGISAIALALGAAPVVGVHVVKQFQVERITAFLHPSANPRKQGYQQVESKIAIGSGQRTGRGLSIAERELPLVPEDHTDFIFAAVGERYGFVGAALVLALFAMLIWRALRIVTMAKDLFGSLIAGGVVAMLMFQVFVNVGMTIGIMPITGVTLPLMSYGGSSVIATLVAVGLLQSIYLRARAAEALKGRVQVY
jgi:rod shape determining protein RodA